MRCAKAPDSSTPSFRECASTRGRRKQKMELQRLNNYLFRNTASRPSCAFSLGNLLHPRMKACRLGLARYYGLEQHQQPVGREPDGRAGGVAERADEERGAHQALVPLRLRERRRRGRSADVGAARDRQLLAPQPGKPPDQQHDRHVDHEHRRREEEQRARLNYSIV